jgi:hypothetical protein
VQHENHGIFGSMLQDLKAELHPNGPPEILRFV